MPTGRTQTPIIAAIPLPPAVGEAVEVGAAVDRRPSAASEIAPVPRAAPAAEDGAIARPALAAGQAAVAAEAGAVVVAASAAVAGGDTGDMAWISCRCTAENSAVNHEVQRLEDGNVARQGHDFAVLRGLCTPRPGDFLGLVQKNREANPPARRAEDSRICC